MIKYFKGIITTCKLIIWSHKYKMLETEINIKKLNMENTGHKLALYLYHNKDILNYVKGETNYADDFNNLITFLNQDDKWKILAKDIK